MATGRGRKASVRFTEELGHAICERLANGESLRAICGGRGMPDESSVRGWATNPKHPFAEQYARARETGYEILADELLDIADDGTKDWVQRRGVMVVDNEVIQRSKLRVDTRKWILARMLPKVYGGQDGASQSHDASQTFVRMLKMVDSGL